MAALSFWPSIDTRIRFIAVCLGIVIVATAWSAEWWRLCCFVGFPIAILVVSRGSWKSIVLRLSVVAAFLVLAGFFSLVFPRLVGHESVDSDRFIFLVSATVFSVCSVQLVAVGSDSSTTIEAVRRLGIPHDIVWMIVLALRYLPLIKDEGIRIHRAAQARLWSPGKRTVRVLGWISASLFIRSFERALRTAQAMEARGYGNTAMKPVPVPLSFWDIVFLLLYPGLLLAVRFA